MPPYSRPASPPGTIRDVSYIALFAALTAIGAFIRIPIPVCPFTLQLLFTTLAGLVLGPAKGAAAVTLYVVLGLAGLPVFTAGGGPSYVFQPTFGYLLGFIAGAWIAGRLAGPRHPWTRRRVFAAVFVNLAVVYGFGVSYTYLISRCYLGSDTALWSLFLYAFAVEVPGDIAICTSYPYITVEGCGGIVCLIRIDVGHRIAGARRVPVRIKKYLPISVGKISRYGTPKPSQRRGLPSHGS